MRQALPAANLVRFAGRLALTALALSIIALVGVQFARVIGANVALAHELHGTQSEITALERHRAQALRELRRLQDPEGAVPEIHDRLKLVRDNEALIFVSPAPSPPAAP